MITSKKQLKDYLKTLEKDELMELVVRLYDTGAPAQDEIRYYEALPKSLDSYEQVLRRAIGSLYKYTAGEIKKLFTDYTKLEKDPDKRIKMYFSCIQTALDNYEIGTRGYKKDHHMIQTACAFYGKALKCMNAPLWEMYKEDCEIFKNRFRELGGNVAFQAISYYQDALDKFEEEEEGDPGES